jgi:hypothetical protein
MSKSNFLNHSFINHLITWRDDFAFFHRKFIASIIFTGLQTQSKSFLSSCMNFIVI